MGLDNGICIRRNEYSNSIKALRRFQDSYDKEGKYDFDLCYWRKCWNVREDIFTAICAETDSQYHFVLDIYDIKEIIKVLKSYNKKTWIYGGWDGSIWEWPEHKKINRRHIRNLKCLVRLMKKYPELEVYFYDSY
jgi:hypothetical protein